MVLAVALAALATAAELFEQGSALFQKGRFADAAAQFEQAARLSPKEARLWKALGVAYAAQEDYERANEPFEKACSLDSALVDACYYYGRNLYALNRFEPALDILRSALRNDPAPWRVHLGMAQSLEALGREAEPDFRKSIALYAALPPQGRGRPDFDPRLHYAVFLFRQGKVEDALTMARNVTAAWPGFGRGHFEVGRALQHLGKLDEAAAELEKAVAGGYGAPAQLLLGRVYLRLGKRAEAEKHLKAVPSESR